MTKKKPNGKTPTTDPAKPTDTVNSATAADTTTTVEVIKFDDAVREGEKALAKFEGSVREANMRLGEIAAKCETKYGEKTLDKLGRALEAAIADKDWAGVFSDAGKILPDDGVAGCTLGRTLERNRSVYLAWDGAGIPAPAPVSWAVLRELQAHPDRAELVKKNPAMTKAEARALMPASVSSPSASSTSSKSSTSPTSSPASSSTTVSVLPVAEEEAPKDDGRRQTERWWRLFRAKANDLYGLIPDVRAVPPERKAALLATTEWQLLPAFRKLAEAINEFVDDLEQLRDQEADWDKHEAQPAAEAIVPETTAPAAETATTAA